MEQEHHELFAIIGMLTYKLQLAEKENDKLSNENYTNSETYKKLQVEFNSIFKMNHELTVENQLLQEKLNEQNKGGDKDKKTETETYGKPQRQYGHEDGLTDTQLKEIFIEDFGSNRRMNNFINSI